MRKKRLIIIVCLLVCGIFLQFLPHGVLATANPTSAGLTEFALKTSHAGWGYVYGTFGQIMTQSMIDTKANQYPDVYAEIMSDGRTAYQHAQKWIGYRAADCVGLMKAYLWWQDDSASPTYVLAQDKSANGLFQSSTIRGQVATIPNIHGLLVWRDGHIGVYTGNGEVIESRGVEHGVVKTRLTDRNWTSWCKHPSVSYPESGWVNIAGQMSYYRGGQYLTGVQTISDKTYYFGPDGFLMAGFLTVDGQIRYFSADGTLLTGWQTIDNSRYYLGTDGIVRRSWQTIDGRNYLFSQLGILLTGWQEQAGAVYYLDTHGNPLAGSQTINNQQMTFSAEGHLLAGWQQQGDNWFYFNLAGQKLTGLQLINGRAYLFDAGGIRQTGWQTVLDQRCYFDPSTGAALNGGLQTAENQAVLLQSDGALNQTAGLFFGTDKLYWSNATGQPLTGLQTLPAYLAGNTAQEAGSPTTVSLQFSDDYSLRLKNQDHFDLDKTTLILTDLAAIVQNYQLTVSGQLPEPAAGSTPNWLSLDPSVAVVDANGLVSARGPGQTLILYRTGNVEYAGCKITVLPDPAALTQPEPATVLEPGLSAELATDLLSGNMLAAGNLSSSNPEIVTVSPGGRLIAHKAGTVTISASFDGRVLFKQTVLVKIPVIGVSADRTALNLPVGGEAPAFARLLPDSGTSQVLIFSSSNPAVASLSSDGTVKGLTIGSAVLTAGIAGKSVSCTVTVAGTYPTLRTGSSGENVRRLQQRLLDLGYTAGQTDGIYGPLTEFAVSSFQKKSNLTITGMADHALQIALQADQAPKATPLRVAGTLGIGDSGEAVFIMQQRLFELNFLKVKPDGAFQALTLQAVKTLQAVNGWNLTENVTPPTISQLYSRTILAGKTTLQQGDAGYEVLMLQTRLAALNYYSGALDSQFSLAVEAAVRKYQTRVGLTADGQAGPLTQSSLFAATAPAAAEVPIVPPAAALPPAPAVSATLRYGSSGLEVQSLENRLVFLGYHYALADSTYDNLTVSSIKAFQRRSGLAQTGIADRQTQIRLNSSTAKRSSVIFRKGRTSGDAVRKIQARLNQLGFSCGTADGKFGSKTYNATRAFQRKAGLTADGIVGSRTLAVLFSTAAPAAR